MVLPFILPVFDQFFRLRVHSKIRYTECSIGYLSYDDLTSIASCCMLQWLMLTDGGSIHGVLEYEDTQKSPSPHLVVM